MIEVHVIEVRESGFCFFCLGVSVSAWEVRDCSGQVQKGIYDWTSLVETDLLKLLHLLPPLSSTFPPTSLVYPNT